MMPLASVGWQSDPSLRLARRLRPVEPLVFFQFVRGNVSNAPDVGTVGKHRYPASMTGGLGEKSKKARAACGQVPRVVRIGCENLITADCLQVKGLVYTAALGDSHGRATSRFPCWPSAWPLGLLSRAFSAECPFCAWTQAFDLGWYE